MNKDDYIVLVEKWINSFLAFHYKNEIKVIEVHKKEKLSSITEGLIKNIDGHSLFDFTPDLFVIFKTDDNIYSCIISVSISSISLKEIGEINLYTKIANPKYSMIISSKGLAKEINLILANKDQEESILMIDDDAHISIFQLNENGKVKEESILPFFKRQEILMTDTGE